MRAILTYHSLDSSGSPISLPPSVFRRHMEWLQEGRVRVVSVAELVALPADADAVSLTFDDGFANFASEAAPLLRANGYPATVFIVTGHVGTDNRWRGRGEAGIPVLPLLGWDALGRLRESGIDLAAHTRTHPRLTALGTAALDEELGAAKEEIRRRSGAAAEGFAYPYGEVDGRVTAAAARYYRWACTTELRPLGSRDAEMLLPRLDAWYFQNPARLSGWGTPAFRAWLWGRRQGRRLRRSLLAREHR